MMNFIFFIKYIKFFVVSADSIYMVFRPVLGLSFVQIPEDKGYLKKFPVYHTNYEVKYANYMLDYFRSYEAPGIDCDFDSGTRPSNDYLTPCKFPLTLLGSCHYSALTNYQFCVYMKMNKVGRFRKNNTFKCLDLWLPSGRARQ